MNETITQCPICASKNLTQHLLCKDHTLSKKEFTISKCDNCEFAFTNPRPDIQSISKYYQSEDYISHQNKSNTLINYLYKLVRNYTLAKKVKLINTLSPKEEILDFGCGTGYFLKSCLNNGWRVEGIEPDSGANSIASKNISKTVFTNLNELPEKQYSIITLWHVLEHVHNLDELLKTLYLKLKKNGKLIIAVPNYKSFDGQHYNSYWAGYDVPRHLYHFEQKTLTTLVKKYNFGVQQILPMKFDSFYVSMLSEKYKGNTKNIIKPIIIGCKSNIYANKTNNYSSLIYILTK